MSHPSRRDYLESKVLTASGPQLHLLLIEGAIRFTRLADQHYSQNNEGHAQQSMLRAMDIVAECLAGVRHDASDLNVKLASLYEFVYRTMVSCYVNSDRTKLAEVLKILDFQRETWQLACEKVTKETPAAKPAKPVAVPLPHLNQATSPTGMVFEA